MVAPVLLAKMTTAITTLGKNAVKLAGAATVMEQLNNIIDKITQLIGTPWIQGIDYLVSMISANTTENSMRLFESIFAYLTSPAGVGLINALSLAVNSLITGGTIIVELFNKVTNFFVYINTNKSWWTDLLDGWIKIMEKIL